MEQQPQSPETDRQQYESLLRRRRLQRLRERAHRNMEHVMMAYNVAKWAVTMAVVTERNREARRVKSIDAERGITNIGKTRKILQAERS